MPHIDVLVVAVQSTTGWGTAVDELLGSIGRAGARVELAKAGPPRPVRTFMLTDFAQARAARRVCKRGIVMHEPAAIIYCSITAALLWPRPGAIWLDSIAAENRPGRHGLWQRAVERQRLSSAPLVLPWSGRSLEAVADLVSNQVPLPPPVEPSGLGARAGVAAASGTVVRDLDVVLYAGDPVKRRLDLILGAWERARRQGEVLVVAGTDAVRAREGVEVAGRLSPGGYRALLRRARVAVAAPRREDHGLAALEALADGCMLVTTPAPGPYTALELARELDPRLVDEDLTTALRIALDDPVPGYAERARELVIPYSRSAVDRIVAQDVLPRLVPGRGQ